MSKRVVIIFFTIFCLHFYTLSAAQVKPGVTNFFSPEGESKSLKGKKVALLSNYAAIDENGKTTMKIVKEKAVVVGYKLVAYFGPEHGVDGSAHAAKHVENAKLYGVPVYSLHGEYRRPTKEMLKGVDVILIDLQDVGSRSYTYLSTMCYVMEEAAKYKIKVIVFDRPNPINGVVVDGLMLQDQWRSFIGYINVPYCHGMTMGELALFFNTEYKVGCNLKVVPMQGWKRSMSFKDTGLTWVPTSPQIPEADTVFYYPMTGLMGELQLLSNGVGYTLPFKLIGAPWIDSDKLAEKLNAQKYPGVQFHAFAYTPFFGRFKDKRCQGVRVVVTDPKKFLPVSTQYLILSTIKTLYPEQFQTALKGALNNSELFNKANGTAKVLTLMAHEPYFGWGLRQECAEAKKNFMPKREKYLLKEYAN